MNFVHPSPKALAIKSETWLDKYKESFDNCPIGKSFSIDAIDVKLSTLRAVVSARINNGAKVFRVINHGKCYEIFRKE